jgi:hypothetical protein
VAACNLGKTVCLHGHPLSGTNIRLLRRPGATERVCRLCELARGRKYRATCQTRIPLAGQTPGGH